MRRVATVLVLLATLVPWSASAAHAAPSPSPSAGTSAVPTPPGTPLPTPPSPTPPTSPSPTPPTSPLPTPPAPPTGLAALHTTATRTELTWQPPADGRAVAYRIDRAAGMGPPTPYATVTEPSVVVEGLMARTYYHLSVSAVDAAGAVSWPVTLTLLTPAAVPAPQSCRLAYRVHSNWQTGFVAGVDITNTGAEPVGDWVAVLRFTGEVQVRQLWNASVARTFGGDHLVLGSAPHNGTLAPGAATGFGFVGAAGGDQRLLSATVNGVACTLA